MGIENIWIFEMQDGVFGGFVIASSEEEAWKRLAIDRSTSVESLKGITVVFPITALDLNKHVHDLW